MFNSSKINLQELQKTLFCVAYKMIGEVAASEDIAQETIAIYLSKAKRKELEEVRHIKKYLVKAATNLSINYLKKIKQAKEKYVGVWLPEPIFGEAAAIDAQIDLDYGVTFLLSQFTPKERAVFILKNAFDFTFKEIGESVDLKEASCRKTFQRLKEKLKIPKVNSTIDKTTKARLLEGLLGVSQENGLTQLINLLKEDITLYSDGGGKVSAAMKPIFGAANCMKFLMGLFKKRGAELILAVTTVNGEPALQMNTLKGDLDTIVVFGLDNFQINQLFFIRNPDKLVSARS